MAIVDINKVEAPAPGAPAAAFDPHQLVAGQSGDFVIWRNNDPDQAHWPTQAGKPDNWWMDDQLPPFVAGQPAATSVAVDLPNASKTADTIIDYVCAIHQAETGTIRIPQKGTT